MEYFGELPSNCPPTQAIETDNFECFRLVSKDGPNEEDFHSNVQKFPSRNWGHKSCEAAGLSFFNTPTALERIQKMPTHKGEVVARLVLPKGSGRIHNTSNDKSHYTWWRVSTCNPLRDCQIAIIQALP